MAEQDMAEQYDTLDNTTLDQLAALAMQRYPSAQQGQLSLLCRSENATYRLIAGGKRYAMRIHRPGYHQREDIAGELAWLDALREEGITVPQALNGLDGEAVQTVTMRDGTVRNVVLFHWIDGEMPTTEVDAAAFEQLGMITARLHQHSRRWERPNGFRRLVWDHDTMVGPQGHWGALAGCTQPEGNGSQRHRRNADAGASGADPLRQGSPALWVDPRGFTVDQPVAAKRRNPGDRL
ncbi:hypothetical protein OS11_33300 [Dickeya oryzae]